MCIRIWLLISRTVFFSVELKSKTHTHKLCRTKTLHRSDFCPRSPSGCSCVILHPQSSTKTALFVALVRLCESCLVKLKAWSSVLLCPKQTGQMFPETQTFILFSNPSTYCSFLTSFHAPPHKTVSFFHRSCNLFIASAVFLIRALRAHVFFYILRWQFAVWLIKTLDCFRLHNVTANFKPRHQGWLKWAFVELLRLSK